MRITIICLWVLIYIGCKEDPVLSIRDDFGTEALKSIKIDAADTSHTLNQIFDFVKITQLDSAESIGTISKTIIGGTSIIIGDLKNTHKIFAYTNDGKLTGTVSAEFFTLGKQIVSFNYNDKQNCIELYDGYNIYCFSLEGKYLRTVETRTFGASIASIGEDKYLIHASFFDTNSVEPYKIKYFDRKGRMFAKAWQQKHFKGFDNVGILNMCYAANKEALLLSQPLNDTIYALDQDQIKRTYFVDFGLRKIKDPSIYQNKPLHEFYTLLKQENASAGIDVILDTEQFLHVAFIQNNRFVSCFFDKRSGKSYLIDPAKRKSIWASFPAFPVAVTKDNQFVYVLEPQEIIRAIKQGKISRTELETAFPELAKAVLSATDYSNPILAFGKLTL